MEEASANRKCAAFGGLKKEIAVSVRFEFYKFLVLEKSADYIETVRKEFKHLVFWTVILSLVTVLVGSFFSLHIDEVGPLAGLSEVQSAQIHNVASEDTGHADLDFCAQGFCHLGHCASLVIPGLLNFSLKTENSNSYFYSENTLVSRFLESPFQPPRLS